MSSCNLSAFAVTGEGWLEWFLRPFLFLWVCWIFHIITLNVCFPAFQHALIYLNAMRKRFSEALLLATIPSLGGLPSSLKPHSSAGGCPSEVCHNQTLGSSAHIWYAELDLHTWYCEDVSKMREKREFQNSIQITDKNLLYHYTGNSTQYSVIAYIGKESKKKKKSGHMY